MKLKIIIAILFLTGSLLFAQTPYYVSLTYQISFPSGNTHDFISNTSFNGLGLESRLLIKPTLSVGISIDGIYFKETWYTMRTVPILLNVHYYMGEDWKFKPFIGIGIGPYYLETRNEANINVVRDDTWHFGISPEFGVAIRRFNDFGIILSGRFHYIFGASGISDQSYWCIKIGAFWARIR